MLLETLDRIPVKFISDNECLRVYNRIFDEFVGIKNAELSLTTLHFY